MTFDDVKNHKYTITAAVVSVIILIAGNVYYPPYHNFSRSFLIVFIPTLIFIIGIVADNQKHKVIVIK